MLQWKVYILKENIRIHLLDIGLISSFLNMKKAQDIKENCMLDFIKIKTLVF